MVLDREKTYIMAQYSRPIPHERDCVDDVRIAILQHQGISVRELLKGRNLTTVRAAIELLLEEGKIRQEIEPGHDDLLDAEKLFATVKPLSLMPVELFGTCDGCKKKDVVLEAGSGTGRTFEDFTHDGFYYCSECILKMLRTKEAKMFSYGRELTGNVSWCINGQPIYAEDLPAMLTEDARLPLFNPKIKKLLEFWVDHPGASYRKAAMHAECTKEDARQLLGNARDYYERRLRYSGYQPKGLKHRLKLVRG